MWAVVKTKQPLELIEGADPVASGTEAVVAVSHCGVCHSDLHFWDGEYDFGNGRIMRIADRGVTLPRAPGHEVVGRVVAVGPDATGVKIGDRRIVYPWIGCGQCAQCRAGNDNLCARQTVLGVVRHGGFSSHVVVPHPRYLVDPGDIDPALASTFACSGITVLSGIRKLGSCDPHRPILLVGAGGLGHAAISTLRALGHRNIVVVDVDDLKRQAALRAGATAVVDGKASDLSAAITAAVGGPLHYAMDFVNNATTARVALDSLGKGGKLVLFGVGGGALDLPLASLIFVPRSIIGTATGSLQDLKDVVALAHSGKLKPIPIERISADHANEALTRLHAGNATGRLVLERPEFV